MNKQLLMTTFFSMLVVSCGTISNSSTSPTSEEPVSNRKVPFNQIGSLVAQVVDAKAMGIVNSKDRPQVNGRRNAQGEDQNYVVKVTETYNPNTQITEDQTIQVTFTRVTSTQTSELQTGTSTHVATADPITVERITDLSGNIVISNVIGHEFRLLSGETVVQDWISSDLETIDFIFDEALTDLVIESRSLNASISFTTFEDFTYTIKQGDQVLYEDLLDNDQADLNEAVGAITISGLIEGLAYDVTYEGYQVIETITQDEVEGQVDKLYVFHQYTFISFVPLNLNQRPLTENLFLSPHDGIPAYDKEGFYSNSTRQSFVIDNNTGLIYKIEGINVGFNLWEGCVQEQSSEFPFHLRITEQNKLEFYSLHQNSSIETVQCKSDKLGNKFIANRSISTYNDRTNTLFYIYNHYDHEFRITKTGEAIEYINGKRLVVDSTNNTRREISTNDVFSFHSFNEYLIKNGFAYYLRSAGGFIDNFAAGKIDLSNDLNLQIPIAGGLISGKYLKEFDILLQWLDGSIFYYDKVFESLDDFFYNNDSEDVVLNDFYPPKLVIEGVVVSGTNQATKFDLNGNTDYIFFPEYSSSGWIISTISTTDYVPPEISIILQPINS